MLSEEMQIAKPGTLIPLKVDPSYNNETELMMIISDCDLWQEWVKYNSYWWAEYDENVRARCGDDYPGSFMSWLIGQKIARYATEEERRYHSESFKNLMGDKSVDEQEKEYKKFRVEQICIALVTCVIVICITYTCTH